MIFVLKWRYEGPMKVVRETLCSIPRSLFERNVLPLHTISVALAVLPPAKGDLVLAKETSTLDAGGLDRVPHVAVGRNDAAASTGIARQPSRSRENIPAAGSPVRSRNRGPALAGKCERRRAVC